VNYCANAGAIIHEMGHTFLDRSLKQVERSDEFKWLGWEICLARLARCYGVWDEQNSTYVVGDMPDGNIDIDGMEWGALSRRVKKLLTQDRIDFAIRYGLVQRKTLRPLSLR
jgi:hypothetical protein